MAQAKRAIGSSAAIRATVFFIGVLEFLNQRNPESGRS
jgi:predicted small integral membrane protein